MEAVAPVDLLARAGVSVTQASLASGKLVPGRNGMTLQATHMLAKIPQDRLFDACILPGGPGIDDIRRRSRVCELLRAHHAAGKLVACICAAPLLLIDAGLTDGLRYTCHPAAMSELPAAAEAPVIRDGAILTSRGAGSATEFALALVEALTGRAKRDEIAASICWSHA